MSKYTTIIERLEKATEWGVSDWYDILTELGIEYESDCWYDVMRFASAGAYTDAAIAIFKKMLPGWYHWHDGGEESAGVYRLPPAAAVIHGDHKTPAIALLIAMFKALEVMEAE